MGRLLGFLADALALARLSVEARGIWREWRGDGETPGSDSGTERYRPAEPAPQTAPPQVGRGETPALPRPEQGAGPDSGPVTEG